MVSHELLPLDQVRTLLVGLTKCFKVIKILNTIQKATETMGSTAQHVNNTHVKWTNVINGDDLSRSQTIDNVGHLLWGWFSFRRKSDDEIVEP